MTTPGGSFILVNDGMGGSMEKLGLLNSAVGLVSLSGDSGGDASFFESGEKLSIWGDGMLKATGLEELEERLDRRIRGVAPRSPLGAE